VSPIRGTVWHESLLIYIKMRVEVAMDANSKMYWQDKEPKTTAELNGQIQSAMLATRQWVDAANISNSEDGLMIEAQIIWLEELLKLAEIELKGAKGAGLDP